MNPGTIVQLKSGWGSVGFGPMLCVVIEYGDPEIAPGTGQVWLQPLQDRPDGNKRHPFIWDIAGLEEVKTDKKSAQARQKEKAMAELEKNLDELAHDGVRWILGKVDTLSDRLTEWAEKNK